MVKNLIYILVFSSIVVSCTSTSNDGDSVENNTFKKAAETQQENVISEAKDIKNEIEPVKKEETISEKKEQPKATAAAKKEVVTENKKPKADVKSTTTAKQTTTPKSIYTPPKKEEKLSTDLIFNDKTASAAKKAEPDVPRPILTFDYKEYDFGIVDEGDTVVHKFYFTNTGKAPAIISEATSSCGCTIPEYPKQPIKPGQRAYIKALFDTKSRLNRQKKSITIKANTQPNWTTLYLRGDVYNRPKKKEEDKEEEKKESSTQPSDKKETKKPSKGDNKKTNKTEVLKETTQSNNKKTEEEDADKKALDIQPPSVTNKVEIEEKSGLKFPKLGKKKKKE